MGRDPDLRGGLDGIPLSRARSVAVARSRTEAASRGVGRNADAEIHAPRRRLGRGGFMPGYAHAGRRSGLPYRTTPYGRGHGALPQGKLVGPAHNASCGERAGRVARHRSARWHGHALTWRKILPRSACAPVAPPARFVTLFTAAAADSNRNYRLGEEIMQDRQGGCLCGAVQYVLRSRVRHLPATERQWQNIIDCQARAPAVLGYEPMDRAPTIRCRRPPLRGARREMEHFSLANSLFDKMS